MLVVGKIGNMSACIDNIDIRREHMEVIFIALVHEFSTHCDITCLVLRATIGGQDAGAMVCMGCCMIRKTRYWSKLCMVGFTAIE